MIDIINGEKLFSEFLCGLTSTSDTESSVRPVEIVISEITEKISNIELRLISTSDRGSLTHIKWLSGIDFE